jgi:glucose/arabinose dehydrogenase
MYCMCISLTVELSLRTFFDYNFTVHRLYQEESTMKLGRLNSEIAFGLAAAQGVLGATDCPSNLSSSYPTPIVADGWSFQLIATGLSSPRGILFDSNGGLLVVQQGAGVIHLTLSDDGNRCVEVLKTTILINLTAIY